MKVKLRAFAVMIGLAFFLVLNACGGLQNVKSETELQGMTAEKILDLGAQAYVENNYKAAEYYYQFIIDNFSEELEEVAWSYYEIGFIRFMKGKESQALEFFQQVLLLDNDSIAPGILAAQMIERIESE